MHEEARHVSVWIGVAADDVYRYASNVANLSKWAPAFEASGPVKVRFVERNTQRVIDHYVTLSSGGEVYVPGRVIPNGKGCDVVLTFFKGKDTTEEDFEKDVEMVEEDLALLKKLLEAGAREPADAVPSPKPESRLSEKKPFGGAQGKPWEKKPFDKAQGKPWEKKSFDKPWAPSPAAGGPAGAPGVANPRNLFVGGIPFDMSSAELETVFVKCGQIAKLRLLSDKETGKSKGLAFVEMATDDGTAAALKLNGAELKGRKIFVTQAKPPDQRDARPAGRKPFDRAQGKPWQKKSFGGAQDKPFERGQGKPWQKKPFGKGPGKPFVPGEKKGKGQRDFRSLGDEAGKTWEPRSHEKKIWQKKEWKPKEPGAFGKFRKPSTFPSKPGGFKKPFGKPGGFKKPFKKP